jgi:prepilin-type N-terminal cleavage/methylation domain-containing protein
MEFFMSLKKKFKGFTLVEVAIVLVIVGLLLAGGINLMSASSDTARYKESQNNLNDIKEALTAYFIQNGGVLPCPDIDNDVTNVSYGQSDYDNTNANGVCTKYEGWLPHVTLGIGGSGDAWGERYKYVVSRAFTEPPGNPPNLCKPGYSRNTANAWRISVYDLLDSTSVAPAKPATGSMLGDWAAFALISTGKNGRQANSAITSGSTGAFAGCGSLDAREQYHCIATTPLDTQPFYLRYGNQMTDGTTVTFDDMVVWVGDMQLISELRKSGLCTSSGSGSGSGSAANPTSRTTADLTANPGQTVSGNYNSSTTAIPTSSGDDKAAITGNMNKALDLQDGNNTLDVQGNANAAITAGSGNDIVRVQGNLTQAVSLGAGNDYLEVWGNANATIDMGAGDDAVRIEGNMSQNVSLGSGINAIYIGGSVSADITATGGTATVYLNAYSSLSSVPSAIKGDSNLTLKCYVSSAWGTCA